MIYVITDNWYFWYGIHSLSGLSAIRLSECNFSDVCPSVVVLVDVSIVYGERFINFTPLLRKYTVIYFGGPEALKVNSEKHYTLNSKAEPPLIRDFIRAVLEGAVIRNVPRPQLTCSEYEVFRLSLRGLLPEVIASLKNTSVRCIYYQRRRVCHKLGVRKVSDLLAWQLLFIS